MSQAREINLSASPPNENSLELSSSKQLIEEKLTSQEKVINVYDGTTVNADFKYYVKKAKHYLWQELLVITIPVQRNPNGEIITGMINGKILSGNEFLQMIITMEQYLKKILKEKLNIEERDKICDIREYFKNSLDSFTLTDESYGNHIEIKLSLTLTQDNQLICKFKDNGPGFADLQKSLKLINPQKQKDFKCAKKNTPFLYGGAQLGLAKVKSKIIEAGGCQAIKNRKHHGCTIYSIFKNLAPLLEKPQTSNENVEKRVSSNPN